LRHAERAWNVPGERRAGHRRRRLERCGRGGIHCRPVCRAGSRPGTTGRRSNC